MNLQKIRLLYVIETLGMGGAERLVVNVLKSIDKNIFSVSVACLFDKRQIEAELVDAGIPVICLALPSQYHWQKAIFDLSRLIKRQRFDIVHTHLFFANIYGRIAAKLTGVKNIITTLHNPDYSCEANNRFVWKLRKAVDKYSGRLCNRLFLAVSEFVKNDFVFQMGYKNIEVLYNCVDIQKFIKLSGYDRLNKRHDLGLEDKDVAILNIGRLHPQKGQLCLLRALRLLRDMDERYKLLIVGSGPLKQELAEETARFNLTGYVKFLQGRNDIPQIIGACDIFAFPSLYEGFGIALIEAMAGELPIVASDIASIREIMRDSIDGLLVEKDNPDSLAGAIRMLANDADKKGFFTLNARKRALDKFDLSDYIPRLEAIYRNLAWQK